MAEDKWEIYEDKAGEWRWRRTASNGNIVGASTEGYKAKSDAEDNARHYGFEGSVKPEGKWEIYQDHAGEWRWRHTHANGNIIGGASEGYTKRDDAIANAKRHGYQGDAQA